MASVQAVGRSQNFTSDAVQSQSQSQSQNSKSTVTAPSQYFHMRWLSGCTCGPTILSTLPILARYSRRSHRTVTVQS
eukprot:3757864-Pyramimonas_sp.AAC.1